ncbi:uncharacterized protein LOC111614364 [Centruroides sculpturatus]|uniref:uncharacterized protein LOC111614364 n=1 Tax=Centruroides sculpturatus TaxID=218467 RepID=UPI000C6E7803|nr:uncharacterized protein LOC111614364 [Centruroides sculpturatus]
MEGNQNTTTQAFADDLLLMVTHQNVDKLEAITNNQLEKIFDWSRENKLPINYEKTIAMVCTRRNKRNRLKRPPRIFINRNKIKMEQEINYLGIVFDDKLNWHTHVRVVCRHMEQKANALNWITAKAWGLNYTNTKSIYEAAVEPAMLYAVQVWKEALNNTHMRRKLTSVQRKFTIKICKAYNTAPTNALLVMADLLPIHLKAKYLIWSWHLTTAENQIGHHIPEEDNIYTDINKNNTIIDVNKKDYGIDRKLKKNEYLKHPAEELNYNIQWDEKNDEEIKAAWKIYTDGSRNANGTGAGLTVINSKNRTTYQCYYKLAPHCTNSQAELLAILKAIQHIDNNIDKFKGSIYILTDSKTSLYSLNNMNRPTTLTKKLLEAAKILGSKRQITFAWIRGHSGNDGNDTADKLAKLGANANIKPSFTGTPEVTLKKYLLSIINTIWQSEWKTADTGRNCFQFIPSVTIRKQAKHYRPNKLTTQVILGHGNFPAYLHRFNLREDNKCDCNNIDIGDAVHFAFNCTKYDNQRSELLHNYLLKNPSWPPTAENIFKDKKLWKTFEDYIHKTDALKEKFNRKDDEQNLEEENNTDDYTSDDESF